MKYHIITFGCQMNKSDSERIATVLESIKYEETSQMKEADLVVINMCSVRQPAVDRVYGLLPQFRALKKKNKAFKVVITGCILKKDQRKIAERFDFVLNKEDLADWPQIIKNKEVVKKKTDYLKIKPKVSSLVQAFVPISNGCDNYCTYCAVPYTRGKLVSRNHKDIIKEVKELVRDGYKEIWLLGENVNSYVSPRDKKIDFKELVKEIDKIEGHFWLRFTSPHPKDFSNDLIKALSKSSKFVPYINLPAQSGDNTILKKMNRPYTREKYIALVKKIREEFKKNRIGLDKEIAISTDMIVGFCGETKEQFKNTAKLLKEVKFDMVYIGKYSPRPQSLSYNKMTDDITTREKKEREKILLEILKKTILEKNKKFVGKKIEVLVLEKDNDIYTGRTKQNKTIKFESKTKGIINTFVEVKVTKALIWGLIGEYVE